MTNTDRQLGYDAMEHAIREWTWWKAYPPIVELVIDGPSIDRLDEQFRAQCADAAEHMVTGGWQAARFITPDFTYDELTTWFNAL